MTGPKWKALTPGSHPPVSRLKHRDYTSQRPVCPCQVPDAVVDNMFSRMWFTGGSTDEWVVQMIHLATVGFVD